MKHFILFSVILIAYFGKSQTFVYSNIQPPSCATCCDGSFVVEPYGGYNSVCMITPNVPVSQSTFNACTFTNVCVGSYTLHCYTYHMDKIEVFTMPLPDGINKPSEENNLRLFPNPTKGIMITNLDGNKTIKIESLDGRSVLTIQSTASTFDLAELKAGVYFISLYDDQNHFLGKKRLIKE